MKKRRIPGRILGNALKGLYKKTATISYPAGKLKIDPSYRGKLKFDPESCNGCQLCVKDCPADALRIENVGPKEDKKFSAALDLDRCVFCAQCIDSCRRNSLSITPDIELAQLKKDKLRIGL